MDARDMKSDLLALQRLYGILKSDGDGMTNPASNMEVDKHARVILKYLLDSATQRALKVCYEILAGQAGVSQAPCAADEQQTNNAVKEQASRLHMTREVEQSFRNDRGFDKERKVDGLDFQSWNDQICIRQRSQVESKEQSTPSADVNGAEFGKKRCRVCQRSTIKQMVTNDAAAKYPDKSAYPQHEVNNHFEYVPSNIEQETGSVLRYKTTESKTGDKRRQIGPFVSNLSGVGSTGFSSDTVVPDITTVCNSNFKAIHKREEADSISKEASEAIEQLESCISNLKIGSDNVHLFGQFSGQHENMDSNDIVYKLTSQSAQSPLNYPSHQVYGVSTEVINQPLAKVQPTNSMFCQSNGHFSRSGGTYEMRESNVEPKMHIHGMDKIESGNWRATRNDFGPNAWNVAVAADQETFTWPSTFSSVPKMESPHQTRLAMKNERSTRYGVCQLSKPANTFGHQTFSKKLESIDSSRNMTSKWGTRVKKHQPNTTATLQERSHQSERQHKNGVVTSRISMTSSRSSLNHQELEDTASSLYSPNTESQQASSYGSVGEDYSFSDQTGSHHITSSTSSESGASPQSHGTMRDYDSCTSKIEDDLYSSTSGDGTPEVTSSSGKSEGYSSYYQPMNHHAGSTYSSMQSSSRKKVPGRISKSASGINHKKPSKTWKSLKDRFAIIFHHHRHDHHHHHDSHDDHRHASHWKKINVGSLFKKREGKIIRSKQEDEAYGERAVEKMRKSLIHDKHQKGHFHGLVEAFSKHIWHAKKSKLAEGTSGKLAKNQRGRKKALKKSRWWKLLQRRRAKFPEKAHVKLGLGKKKTHLKALRN